MSEEVTVADFEKAELDRLLREAQAGWGELMCIISNIEQCRCVEGDSITILCDNPEAEMRDEQACVEVCGDYTGYKNERFYGTTWVEALKKAVDCARMHYRDDDDYE